MKKHIYVLLALAIAVFAAGCINGPPYIVKEDMNNDGIADTVITQYDAYNNDLISVLFGGSNESFAKEIEWSSIKRGSTIILDLNSDGKQDIIYQSAGSDGRWKVLYGKGDGDFEKSKDMEPSDMRFVREYKSN